MDFEELTKVFTPLTLTESISRIKTDEPFVLKSRLGHNVQNMLDELCVYEVEEGSYHLAPLGFPNDPPSNVNIAHKRTPYAVTPPQIYMKDRVTASEINKIRNAAQNSINMSLQDKESAYNQLIGIKQKGLLRLVDRRIEWFFAQALRGKVDYVSETGRTFKHDYNLAKPVDFGGEYWNKKPEPSNPIHQLRHLAKHFKTINNQLAPDLIIMGGAAGDAFLNNPHVEGWMKSPGVQLFQNQTTLAKGEAVPIGVLQGAELFEYSATFENERGKAMPYIEEDYVYMTHSSLWRLFYGAINDFDAGNPPLVVGSMFSKMKISQDGKVLDIFLESHPLPVLINNLGVVKAKVVD